MNKKHFQSIQTVLSKLNKKFGKFHPSLKYNFSDSFSNKNSSIFSYVGYVEEENYGVLLLYYK